MRYIALLRGVNVGGKNMLPMAALKAALEADGLSQVRTYINSGNILFTSDSADEDGLRARMEALIQDRFSVQTPVAIFSAGELAEALRHAPAWWNADPAAKHNAIFLIPPLTAEAAYAAVGDIRPEYEQVDAWGRVIFWSAPLKTFSRSRWSKVVGMGVYGGMTIRNANTAMKLLTFAQEA